MTLAVILVATATASLAGFLLLRPAAAPAYRATAPPLALGPNGPSPAASPAAAGSPALTVRLIIPAGSVDLPVVQGDGVTVPLHLAMHYPGTDQPGGGSNALYYAHAQPGMFQGLFSLHPGDAIDAVRSDGSVLHYKAATFKKVPYNDRGVLAATPYDEITLLTCTSYDPYTPRYIVVGLPA